MFSEAQFAPPFLPLKKSSIFLLMFWCIFGKMRAEMLRVVLICYVSNQVHNKHYIPDTADLINRLNKAGQALVRLEQQWLGRKLQAS
jgi:hypothetical protein